MGQELLKSGAGNLLLSGEVVVTKWGNFVSKWGNYYKEGLYTLMQFESGVV